MKTSRCALVASLLAAMVVLYPIGALAATTGRNAPGLGPVRDPNVVRELWGIPTGGLQFDLLHAADFTTAGLHETFVPVQGQRPGLIGAVVVTSVGSGAILHTYRVLGTPVPDGTRVTLIGSHGERPYTQVVHERLANLPAQSTGEAGGQLQPLDDYVCTTFCYLLTVPIYEGNVIVGLLATLACTVICSTSATGTGGGTTSGGGSN